MKDIGPAWLGDDQAPCLYRELWEGRVTEVNAEPDGDDDWWFSAYLAPVDGIGNGYTGHFARSVVAEQERDRMAVGAVVWAMQERVHVGGHVESRYAIQIRRDTGIGDQSSWSGGVR
jgi:hypothetical protein